MPGQMKRMKGNEWMNECEANECETMNEWRNEGKEKWRNGKMKEWVKE